MPAIAKPRKLGTYSGRLSHWMTFLGARGSKEVWLGIAGDLFLVVPMEGIRSHHGLANQNEQHQKAHMEPSKMATGSRIIQGKRVPQVNKKRTEKQTWPQLDGPSAPHSKTFDDLLQSFTLLHLSTSPIAVVIQKNKHVHEVGLNLPTYRSFQTENPTPQPPTLPQPFPGRARVEESDLLRPAILALLQGDPIALRKGLGQVDHQAAQHVAQHIPGRARSPGWWMLGPRCELKFGAEVSFWDQPNEITPDPGVCWSHSGSYPVNGSRGLGWWKRFGPPCSTTAAQIRNPTALR